MLTFFFVLALIFFFGVWRTVKFAAFAVAASALCVALLLTFLMALL